MRDIEQIIREVNATMAIEGMPLTEKEEENIRALLRGDMSSQQYKKEILAKYLPKRKACDRE